MIDDKSKLNSIAQGELETLRSEGIEPTWEDVVMINALAWEIESPQGRLGLSRGMPCRLCDGVILYPLTNYGKYALQNCEMNRLSSDVQTYVTAYCMCHGHIKDALDFDLVENAKRWASRLPVTKENIIIAVANVFQQEAFYEQPQKNDYDTYDSITIGDLIVMLQSTCGEDADFWERRCSASYASEVLCHTVKTNMANGKNLGNEPRIMATRALGWYVEKVRMRSKDGKD